jgi:hypothetical protein
MGPDKDPVSEEAGDDPAAMRTVVVRVPTFTYSWIILF